MVVTALVCHAVVHVGRVGGLQADLHEKLPDPKLNIALENHEYGMPPEFYERWPILSQWYNILSTTKDRNGTEYISTMEGKKYPFTGGQG